MGTLAVVDLDELEQRMEALLRRVLDAGPSRAVTKKEAADRLGVSVRTVTRWVKAGELPSVRLGTKTLVRLDGVLGSRHASQAVVGNRVSVPAGEVRGDVVRPLERRRA